ncbi:hypothetical protein BDV93DRAFT_548425 [Ceratobasidium sp. AG-I]|nr:hypothetical protein BDV93DRAFT_548425 [Ceratobasidium sp. AG-I]
MREDFCNATVNYALHLSNDGYWKSDVLLVSRSLYGARTVWCLRSLKGGFEWDKVASELVEQPVNLFFMSQNEKHHDRYWNTEYTSSNATSRSSASSASLDSTTDTRGPAIITNNPSVTSSTVSGTSVSSVRVQNAPSATVMVLIIIAKQRSAKDLLEANHEPKRQESVIPDAVPYFPTASNQSHVCPLGGGARSISRQKTQSLRASSSIVLSDEVLPMNSRSNFLKPLSLGKSTLSFTLRGMELANNMPALAEDQNSSKLPPNLSITTTPGRAGIP